MKTITNVFVKQNFPKRPENSHKGTFGKVLSVCGSETMMGAAILAAKSAFAAGAGYVAAAVPRDEKNVIFTSVPEAVALPLKSGRELKRIKAKYAVVLLGPGLEQRRAEKFLKYIKNLKLPLVLDGDGLNALSKNPFGFDTPAILTPHPLEAERLMPGVTDREKMALSISAKYNAVCVLKGRRTIVADKNKIMVNTTGNSALAKAGTGDVLAGLISGLWAQLGPEKAFEAACCAAFVHGLAGEKAGKELSKYGVSASDVIRHTGAVIKQIL